MLSGSAGSPFRSNSGHRAPWPPPTLHATTDGFSRFGAGGGGGLYSLFPGPGGGGGGASETSAAIYSHATSAARFAHSTSAYRNFMGAHKVADSLFSSGYTFGGPTPPPPPAAAPAFSPVGPLVERGITQLELMAKGFNNNNNNSNNNNNISSNLNGVVNESNTAGVPIGNNKKVEHKRRSECALYQETVERRSQQSTNGGSGTGNKRRWERDSSSHALAATQVVKSEATSRPSCGCRGSSVTTSSPSPLALRNGHNHHSNGNMASSDNNGASSFPQQQCSERKHEHSEHSSGERKKHDSLVGSSGGCSRTNPVSLRNGGSGNSVSEWPNGGLVQIKKEPVSSSGGSSTPCLQVAEVTTSIRPHQQQQNAVSALSHVVGPHCMAAVVKLEAAPCSTSPCNGGVNSAPANGGSKSMQHPSINSSAIPVGIAVARQRLQDHSLQSSGTKPDLKASQAASCRQQKTLVPAPPEPQCSAADIVPAPAPPPLSAMVLQPQCEERSTNGLAPWAATTSHNPALTPPTLWQYPAHVPVQLGPSEHLPLPPVGYQLVRDPITGHFLLIPATNIEHLQRAVLWPGYPATAATVQPSLQVTTPQQPTAQHIQLFEPAEPPEYLAAPTTRILVQPQLTIATAAAATAVTVATDTIQGAAKRTTKQQATTLIKIEPAHSVSECSGGTATGIVVDNANMKPLHRLSPNITSRSMTTEVSVATNTTPAPQAGTLFPTGATTALQAHFYYEHHTHHPTSTTTAAVVQLSQTPQPSAAVQTDNGKRSQATSPVNPAETCLTPPPETTASQSECEDASTCSVAASVCGTTEQGSTQQHVAVMVQDASNQTDTLPISEDDSCCDSVPVQEKLHPHEVQPKQEPPESFPCDVKPVCTEVPSTFESKSQPDDSLVVDLSGLELLSNSIEQFENHHTHHSSGLAEVDNSSSPLTADSSSIPSKLSLCSSSSLADTKQEISDLRPADEKAAETLQMLCQQSTVNQMKSSIERLSPREHLDTTFSNDESAFSENCDSKVLNAPSGQICVSDFSNSSNDNAECGKILGDMCLNQVSERVQTTAKSFSGGTNMLGGLGLLCALAEQRFMEEVATSTENSTLTSESSAATCDDVRSSSSPALSDKLLESSPEVSGAGVDVNRNYKTRKSERECKKFIASKVLQYYHHHSGTGNNSESSSPQHCPQQVLQPQQVVSLCASPSSSSAEIMDAMELNMRMKLAELQRKYREKQRELSKLTPKKSSLADVSSNEVSDAAVSASPVKRGPGRPRKKCNKLCLDSPSLSPPGGAVSTGPRPKVGRPPLLKSRETHGTASTQELPPPVLEKVTELTARPRPRFDADDDCAAPKLKASKPDILKPPTLTANRILTCAKFKPSAVSGNNNNIVTKGLRLPQCNVNLVKLATNHHGNVTKVKDASGKLGNESGGARKCSGVSSSLVTGDLRSKHGGISVMTDLSVADKQRSGENDSLFWFKTSVSKSSNVSRSEHEERSSLSFETSDGHKAKLSPSPPPLSPSLPPCLSSSSSTSSTSSSSKKRKVGRPKKHFSVTGREVATETIVAKKPKSKSSLVGLLLSKSRHTKPLHMKSSHSVSHKPLTNSHVDSSIPSYGSRVVASHKLNGNSSGGADLYHKPLSNSNRNNASSYSDSETTCLKTNGATKVSDISGGDGLDSSGIASKRSGTSLTVLERKPNKIRPKLKAEAKVKTWSYGEDEDGVTMDWPGSKVEPVEPVITPPSVLSQTVWTKKSEPKVEKPVPKVTAASTPEVVFRSRKRKPSSNDAKPVTVAVNSTSTVATAGISTATATTITTTTSIATKTVVATTTVATTTTTTTTTTTAAAAAAAATSTSANKSSKKAKPVRERRDKHPVDGSPPAKKQKRSSSSCGQGTTSSESEDIPLSILSKQNAAGAAVTSTTPCQLTQVHLNTEKQRALAAINGLFYAGTLSAIQAPDIYGITLDGERGNRPHIYSREGILQDAIIEVRPTNISELTPGTRVCAYWSQQYRCLYPGTVAQPSSPDPELDSHFVNVEFDDGDSGRINIDDIRLLPSDYPVVEYDSNPIWGSGKRRRRISGASCESRSKDRRTSAEAASSMKSGTTTQKQVPQTKETLSCADKNTAEISEKKQQVPAVSSSKTDSAAKGSSKVSDMTGLTTTTKTSAISSPAETSRITTENDVTGKTELSDRSSSCSSGRERKRLKKRRREKLKRLLASATGESGLSVGLKKHRKKHRCSGGEEHCRHRRHHKRHRKHRHRNHNSGRGKDCSSGSSSAESGFKPGVADGDTLSRLSPVLEQLDILEIQQRAIRQLTTEQESAANTSVTPVSTVTPVTSEATKPSQPVVVSADGDDSESEAEQGGATEVTPELPKQAEVPVPSVTDAKKTKKEKESVKPKKGRDRQPSVESRSKMAAFLPARQLWGWSGRGFKRPGAKGRGKKEFYKAIQRGKETIRVGDCAVFLSTGRPDRPYIGRIESMWESWGTNMVVRVKWFYHPEETNGCPAHLQYPGALFESPHVDENDVQTISHKCEVLPLEGYTGRLGSEPQRYSTVYDNNDIYYLAGYYDPTTSQLTMEPGVV